MFDVHAYFKRIGYTGTTEPTLENLRAIHKGHLTSIAFDNTLNADAGRGVEVLDDVDIDRDEVFNAVVTGGRGGVCYELNGLMRYLLTELRYDVHILAAAVLQVNGKFGPDFEHILNCVELDGDLWLVDVGLAGPSYLEPLKLTGEVQPQYGVDYRILDPDDEGYRLIQRRPRDADWSPLYKFKLEYRDITDWTGLVARLADFPVEEVLVGTRIHSRAFQNGQMVLIGKRYVHVEDGKEEIRVLAKPAAFKAKVREILQGA